MISSWSDIDGWFDYEQFYAAIAAILPDNAVCAEVGVYLGRSVAYLAERLRYKACRIYAIDLWSGEVSSKEALHQRSTDLSHFDHFKRNMGDLGLDNVYPVVSDSAEAAAQFSDSSMDFVFIDASHDYNSVRRDILAWWPKVKLGGILAGHDYDFPSVRSAVWNTLGQQVTPTETVWAVGRHHHRIEDIQALHEAREDARQ